MKQAAAITMALLTLAGCVHMPTGPSVAVMPAPNKPFDVFVTDDQVCRNFANGQMGNGDAQREHAAGTAVGAAALGAAAGALLANNSRGAGVGAGAGLLIGTLAGSGEAQESRGGLQRQYDVAYEQCMYSKGNQVPGFVQQVAPPPPAPPRR
jgi:hypothetical protein